MTYKKPSSSDIDALKRAQENHQRLYEIYKGEDRTRIYLKVSIGMVVLGAIGSIQGGSLQDFWFTICGFGVIGTGVFIWWKKQDETGSGRNNKEMILETIKGHVNNIECKWTEDNAVYYVYTKDLKNRVEVKTYVPE
jgi:hypothetical protein|tara:strand:+ start:49 stop:459 length:411 start_codon:yes stop_codon:yes gene_type:complete